MTVESSGSLLLEEPSDLMASVDVRDENQVLTMVVHKTLTGLSSVIPGATLWTARRQLMKVGFLVWKTWPSGFSFPIFTFDVEVM